jgi:hypothetical protein
VGRSAWEGSYFVNGFIFGWEEAERDGQVVSVFGAQHAKAMVSET